MRPHILHNGLHRIGDQLNHFIDGDRFWGRDPFGDTWMTRGKRALANVATNQKNFDLEVALPGFKKEEISVSLQGSVLTVTAGKDNPESGLLRQEFSGSSMKRIFRLPNSVDTRNIQASLEQGILHIRMPYAQKSSVIHIPVH